jgi:gamma-glutamylcyclotransferase (GGCT)/AIG2-like uncharacterized protein YtfP
MFTAKPIKVLVGCLLVVVLVVVIFLFLKPTQEHQEMVQDSWVISSSSPSIVYFAYGSNLNTNNMHRRCGDHIKIIGPAKLNNYELTFDRRGYANIIPKEAGHVWGLIWEIDQACVDALDIYEGYPKMYDRQNISVILDDQNIGAFVYIQPADQSGGRPAKNYLENLIIVGAKENGLPVEWIRKLEEYKL